MNERRLIIVTGDGYESEYAIKLHTLLSSRDINSAIWTEKEYLSNRPKLSNKERLIFFGLGSMAKKQEAVITNWAFEQYACRIGWLGNTCVITAWDGDLSWDDLPGFSRLCKLKAVGHPDIVIPGSDPKKEVWSVVKGVFTDKNNNSAWRAQYSLLVHEFMDNWLDDFMGIKQANEDGENSEV